MDVTQSSPYRGTVSGSYEESWFSFFDVTLAWRF